MQFPDVIPVVPGGLQAELPAMAPLRQRFPEVSVTDVASAVRSSVSELQLPSLGGKSVAITAGSRGIPGYVEILRALVAELEDRGAEPFIVPAMGSHGGATAEGQLKVLSGYGVTEEAVGAPIRSSLDTVVIGHLPDGTPLHTDRIAAAADGIVVFNKIKPHTAYKSAHESGLAKMLAIGLGKHQGARAFHLHDFAVFPTHVPAGASALLQRLPVLFGLAVVENAWGEAAVVEAVAPERLMERDAELLSEAKRLMGRLLMPRVDVLVVDQIGKNISGAGMDPNVTGRPSLHAAGFDYIKIQKIIVRGLTAETGGNAAGIGNADFTTTRCVAGIDLVATYTNVFSARVMQGGKLPVVLPNDRLALTAALLTCNGVGPHEARVVWVRDTKHLDVVQVSPTVLADVRDSSDFAVVGEPRELLFDDDGYLLTD